MVFGLGSWEQHWKEGPGTGQTREGESGQQFTAQTKAIKAPPQVLGGPATQLTLCTYICSTAWPSPTMGGHRESPGRLPTLETHLPPGYQCSACSLRGAEGEGLDPAPLKSIGSLWCWLKLDFLVTTKLRCRLQVQRWTASKLDTTFFLSINS